MTVAVERRDEQKQDRGHDQGRNPLGLISLALALAFGVIVIGAVASIVRRSWNPPNS